MKLIVAAVGRLKSGPERDLAARYRERVAALGRRLGFRSIVLEAERRSAGYEY